MKYLAIILLSLLIAISFSSCGILTTQDIRDGYSILKELTMSKDSTQLKTPVDSLPVRFNSVYFVEPPCDSLGFESENEFKQDGYNIWSLRTPKKIRYEIRKLDTVIYFYKK